MSLSKRISILAVIIAMQSAFMGLGVRNVADNQVTDYFLLAVPHLIFLTALAWEMLPIIAQAMKTDTSTSVAGGEK